MKASGSKTDRSHRHSIAFKLQGGVAKIAEKSFLGIASPDPLCARHAMAIASTMARDTQVCVCVCGFYLCTAYKLVMSEADLPTSALCSLANTLTHTQMQPITCRVRVHTLSGWSHCCVTTLRLPRRLVCVYVLCMCVRAYVDVSKFQEARLPINVRRSVFLTTFSLSQVCSSLSKWRKITFTGVLIGISYSV